MTELRASAHMLVVEIAHMLDSRGAWWIRLPRRGVPAGMPHMLACYKGRFIALDVRGGSGPGPRAAERFQLEALDRAGAVTLVARSVGEVSAILDDLDRNPPEMLALERLIA